MLYAVDIRIYDEVPDHECPFTIKGSAKLFRRGVDGLVFQTGYHTLTTSDEDLADRFYEWCNGRAWLKAIGFHRLESEPTVPNHLEHETKA